MTIRFGVVMDPIGSIKIRKDSTFAMLLEAQARGWTIEYMEQGDLFLRDGRSYGRMRRIALRDDPSGWYTWQSEPRTEPLDSLHVILMRKDPPFDMEYIYTTYLLERAEEAGCWWSTGRPACATPTKSSTPPGSPSAAHPPW